MRLESFAVVTKGGSPRQRRMGWSEMSWTPRRWRHWLGLWVSGMVSAIFFLLGGKRAI